MGFDESIDGEGRARCAEPPKQHRLIKEEANQSPAKERRITWQPYEANTTFSSLGYVAYI
ncbi:uncharacterized protein G2W53_039967 [Senna tora]|uniref:Uncharacterized protein n=1 Tax=Senna tora TaxID=362788 RepID=A0A834SQU2_9FABA|nr:uncharacterized protein G2W53_039967 [Senna tora]